MVGLVSTALLVTAIPLGSAAAQTPTPPATPPPSLADSLAVNGSWHVLDRAFRLGVRSKDREDQYRLERLNLVLGRTGELLTREVSWLTFGRASTNAGASVRYAWEAFGVCRARERTTPSEEIVPLPEGSTYEFDPKRFSLADVSDVRGPDSHEQMFRVLVLDALTWDLVVAQLTEAKGGRVRIGDRSPLEGPAGPQPVPGGSYELGVGELAANGLTRIGGEAALSVDFAIDGSRTRLATGGVELSGHEFIRGSVAISLHDGRVLGGRLWGPLVAALRRASGEELPVGAIIQYVTLESVPLATGRPETADDRCRLGMR